MQRYDGQPPDEVLLPALKTEEYLAWRATTDLRGPYRIAPEFLRGTKPDADFETDEAPLIVFINARSGGRLGPELANVLARAVGSSQVYDLSEYRPDKVLSTIWANLRQQEQQGNQRAAVVRSRLRILACGGDGTVAWIFKVIRELDLQPQPPVAIMPLGTGNDLSRSFKWGPVFEHGWIKGHASIYSTLKRVADAQVSNLDCWRLRLLLPNATYKPAKTYAMTEVEQPEQGLAAAPGCAGESSSTIMEGLFWNYFSVGADAQAAYNFHHLRDNHPMLASNRVANQFWYSTFGCTSGWFCGTVPSISRFSKVQVLQPGSSSWGELCVPASIKALVFVNLQSYAGGRNVWGAWEPKQKGRWRQPNAADGLIEVVGFHSGYHAMMVFATNGKVVANGKRLAQVAGIRLSLHDLVARPDNEPGQVFMQLDGEPWVQKVPAGNGDNCVVLEVAHAGVTKVLSNTVPPVAAPDSKMAHLLGQQQAAAYLTTTPSQPAPESDLLQQQQHPRAHVAAEEQPSVGSCLPSGQVVLPPETHQGAAAHQMLQPPNRVAYTDGGAPCSSAPAGGASMGLTTPRRSLTVQPSACDESSGAQAAHSPTSSNSTEVPSAVAVIEACVTGGVLKAKRLEGQQGKAAADGAIRVVSSPKEVGLHSTQQLSPALAQEKGKASNW